jgi:hypothetical protein
MPDKFLRFIHCLLQPNASCCEHSHSNPGSHPLYFNSGATVGRLCHTSNWTSTPASHLQLDLNACVAPRRHFLPSSCISWHCIQRCIGRVPCNRAQLPVLLTATLQPTFRNIARFNKHHITSGGPLVGMRRTAGRTHRGRLPWASLMPRAQECAASTATEE